MLHLRREESQRGGDSRGSGVRAVRVRVLPRSLQHGALLRGESDRNHVGTGAVQRDHAGIGEAGEGADPRGDRVGQHGVAERERLRGTAEGVGGAAPVGAAAVARRLRRNQRSNCQALREPRPALSKHDEVRGRRGNAPAGDQDQARPAGRLRLRGGTEHRPSGVAVQLSHEEVPRGGGSLLEKYSHQ